MIQEVVTGAVEVVRAMALSLRYFFTKPITVQFPEEPVRIFPRWRGRHVLERYEDGLEKCVGCGLCEAVCPAGVIYVQAGENTPEHRVSPGERYGRIYEVNMSRCIFCGYCEEACPTGAIKLRHDFMLSEYDRGSLLYDKERLLKPTEPNAVVVED